MSKRILAVASAGGHWQQLMLLRAAYTHHSVHYVTTLPGLADQFDARPSTQIPDCNRDTPVQAIKSVFALLAVILRVRPHVVISTGALPGVIALAMGRLIGARTIWVDSVANAEEMSSSGRLAKRFAHLRLSQWETPARAEGAEYAGSVL
jgi:UDP-N-acetylglucosamine:LPS N-acetylglucosamine transferase